MTTKAPVPDPEPREKGSWRARDAGEPSVLVVIASYGTKNLPFLRRALEEYRSWRSKPRIVVTSDAPKDLGADVEVRVGLPTADPRSLPFAHRQVFQEHVDAHDVFLYAEDDLLVREASLHAFLRSVRLLGERRIAALVRFEVDEQRERHFCDIHSHYRFEPGYLHIVDGESFAKLTNPHSGCYFVTREQLRRAIASGGYLVPPHAGPLGMLECAASDIYTQCGFERLVHLGRLEDFLVHHQPNVYVGRLGVPERRVREQLLALIDVHAGRASPEQLFDGTPALDIPEWEKMLFEPPSRAVIEAVGKSPRSVLSIGCGGGATEELLAREGHQVTVIPYDNVVVAGLAGSGVRVLPASLERATAALQGASFDCVVLVDVLQFVAEPVDWLRWAVGFLREGGRLIVGVENLRRATILRWRGGHRAARLDRAGLRDFGASGLQWTSRRTVSRWLRRCGIDVTRCEATFHPRAERISRFTAGIVDDWIAKRWLLVGTRSMSADLGAPSR